MPPGLIGNTYSQLLSNEENLQVFKLLGNLCQSLSTTKAQLFLTKPPHHSEWIQKDEGVLCFVQDNIRSKYFFRLFCLHRNMMIWEQEMLENMEYNVQSTEVFQIFGTSVAFNFENIGEAQLFKIVVNEKIRLRKMKEAEQRANQQLNNIMQEHNDRRKVQNPVALKQGKRKKKSKKLIIGAPMEINQIAHIGTNSKSGFDMYNYDVQLKPFFEKAGITERHLRDPNTKQFIYGFVNKNGGIEAVRRSMNECSVGAAPQMPPPTARPAPPIPSQSHVRPAPLPPPIVHPSNAASRESEKPILRPPPTSDFGLVPPPPAPPSLNDMMRRHTLAPPPPPPPLQGIGTEAYEHEHERKMPQSHIENLHGQLLEEIHGGVKLRHVKERDMQTANNVIEPKMGNDLAEALAKAIAERNRALHSLEESDDGKFSDFD